MSREAMKMALEALVFAQYEDRDYDDVCDQKVRAARDALRQALVDADDTLEKRVEEKAKREHEWVGLTDEEIKSVCYKRDWTAPWTDTTFARAIEAKLKEKNHG